MGKSLKNSQKVYIYFHNAKKTWDWKNRQRRRQWWKIITQRLYTKVRACLSWALQPLLSFKGKLLQGKKIAWFQSGRKVRCTCGAGYCSGHASVIAFFLCQQVFSYSFPGLNQFFMPDGGISVFQLTTDI